jgi:DNA polymerase I-like protein with 3'-5' exonuclease and polymerase domains
MYNIDESQVTKMQRQIGKTIRHASNYSAGPGVLAAKLGCTMVQAKTLLQLYHDMCPQLRLWHQRIRTQLEEKRTLYNLFGRKHVFTDRWGDALFRSAYSYIPQSTVGDLLNRSLVDIYNKYGHEILIMLQLHDAIYCCVKPDEAKQIATEVLRPMMLHELEVNYETFTIDVDFKLGPSWGELSDFDA